MEKSKVNLKDLFSGEAKSKVKALSFEDGIKILEDLVSTVESGSLALDKTIQSYEIASLLTEHLRSQLSGAEEKLKVLQKDGSVAK